MIASQMHADIAGKSKSDQLLLYMKICELYDKSCADIFSSQIK